MKKKISRILIILLYFTPCNIIILVYILFAWSGSYITEKTYYIPETDTYMKIYEPGTYITFDNNKNFTISDTTDYFTLPRFGTIIYYNLNNKSFYVSEYDRIHIKTGKIRKLNDKYGEYLDTQFLEQYKREKRIPDSTVSYVVISILEYGYFPSIWDFKHQKWINIKMIEDKRYFNSKYFKSKFRWLLFWENDNDIEPRNDYFLFYLNQKNDNGK